MDGYLYKLYLILMEIEPGIWKTRNRAGWSELSNQDLNLATICSPAVFFRYTAQGNKMFDGCTSLA